MSQLQVLAKPMLEPMMSGETLKLSARDNEVLASWIAMTSMVGDFSHRPTLALAQADRTALFEHRTQKVPLDLPGWGVGLGHYLGSDLGAVNWRRYRYQLPEGQKAHATTIVMNELLVVAHSGVVPGGLLGSVAASVGFEGAVAYVYPTASDNWPPPVKLHDALAERVIFRSRAALQRALIGGHPGMPLSPDWTWVKAELNDL